MKYNGHCLTPMEAEEVSLALSDVLCWVAGFKAAREGTDLDASGPEGIKVLRDLNVRLKRDAT